MEMEVDMETRTGENGLRKFHETLNSNKENTDQPHDRSRASRDPGVPSTEFGFRGFRGGVIYFIFYFISASPVSSPVWSAPVPSHLMSGSSSYFRKEILARMS